MALLFATRSFMRTQKTVESGSFDYPVSLPDSDGSQGSAQSSRASEAASTPRKTCFRLLGQAWPGGI